MRGSPHWFAGLGLRHNCPADELAALLDVACAEAGIDASALNALASLDRRTSAPGLCDLARTFGLALQGWPAEVLTRFDDRLSYHSPRVRTRYGVGGIAEAAALASAANGNPDTTTRLAVPRRQSASATVAIAVRETVFDAVQPTSVADGSPEHADNDRQRPQSPPTA